MNGGADAAAPPAGPGGASRTPLSAARAVLKASFGFDELRPDQAPVIEALLSGEDALAVMPTGSGKSLCYQVPALVLGGLTVVVSPLVALMEDQVAQLRLNGIPAETINSARDRADNVAAWRRVASGEARLLFLSPERLVTGRMLDALGRISPCLFAVDEAHCISRWGAAFRPEYEQLGALREAFPRARLAAFTATADPATREDIVRKLFRGPPRVFVAGFDRPNIRLGAAPRSRWQDQLEAFLAPRPQESGIVYCLSRKNVDEVAAHLLARGRNALPYHAGLNAADRTENQNRFMTESPVVMVATIAFGMGIDKPDIRFVVHTHLPANIESYYQEIGRAGRDGLPAEALMLHGLDDVRLRRRFIEQDGSGADHMRREHKRLDALVAFAEAATCRRAMLLGYFGERAGACGNCDVCIDPPVVADATPAARIALSAVRETGQRFGPAHIVEVLRGAETQRLVALGHHRLPSWGAGKDRPKPWWQAFLRQLVSAGHLALDIEGYGGLGITPSGEAIRKGEAPFACPEISVPPRGGKRPAAAPSVPIAPADEGLLARLKAHRLELARARSVPPYVIFHDRTLIAMASTRPRTREQFLGLPGVGSAKCDAFADSFLAIVGGEGMEPAP